MDGDGLKCAPTSVHMYIYACIYSDTYVCMGSNLQAQSHWCVHMSTRNRAYTYIRVHMCASVAPHFKHL